jgi:GTP cyclohydrolase III
MITFEELNTQNHEITELTNVLSYLLADRTMCDTDICCDLFYRYANKVKAHLDLVDHTYTDLLSSSDTKVNNTARMFMEGSREIRRIFAQYTKTWCEKRKQALNISSYDKFLKETSGMFDLVLKRIQDETEHLYPLIREIKGDSQRAA